MRIRLGILAVLTLLVVACSGSRASTAPSSAPSDLPSGAPSAASDLTIFGAASLARVLDEVPGR